jgi:hypothetical protein
MPRRAASAGDSSTRWLGLRKRSAGEASTSGAAQTERKVPRRSLPFGSAATGGACSVNGAASPAGNADAAAAAFEAALRADPLDLAALDAFLAFEEGRS